ncbi:unnamed protein product [Ectocarpus fasciculatus]
MSYRLRSLRGPICCMVPGMMMAAYLAPARAQQQPEPDETALSTRLATQLEEWLVPSDGAESLGLMIKDLRDAVSEDIQISADEGKRLPLNFLMVKAMHDRQLLAQRSRTAKASARNRPRADLSPRDRRTLRKSAHYARFAAASYDGVVDTVKEILAEGDTLPPPDLFAKSNDDLRKWCISKRTGVDPSDVKELATSDSLETRTYFVAVDHASRSVVVSIRGTYSFTDTMVDLLCNTVDFAGGKAHQGISQSAVRVWTAVKGEVEKQLREHSDYKLVLTGHSLGAGTAILLKILLERNATEALKGGFRRAKDKTAAKTARLDVSRPVRVECYAFAPPPVFSGPGATWMRDVYSFVNGADCVPTMSLGSLYSLCRTIQHVDKLPLDVYKRAEFVLDSRVRVQQSEQGLGAAGNEDDRRKIASDILGLRAHPSLAFLAGDAYDITDDEYDDDGEEEEEARKLPEEVIGGVQEEEDEAEEESEDSSSISSYLSAIREQVVRSTISKFGEEWARFTQDVGEATESLLSAVNTAGSSAESLYKDVSRVTDGVRGMSSNEVALTLLLLKQLATGGGPSPDEMLPMVQRCEKEGVRPQQGKRRSSDTMTVGDLIIPGVVFLLEGWDAGSESSAGKGGLVTVRKTSSEDLGGIRLNSSMMADHAMGAYEPAILGAALKYRKRKRQADRNGN